MTFDLSSAPIVRLAWERGLGLPTDALLHGNDGGRLSHAVDTPALTFLRLWDQSVLTGPAVLLAAAQHFSDDELSDHAVLLRLSRELGGRGGGTATLYYADELELRQPAGTLTVSPDTAEAGALEALCPPDDVHDVGLGTLPHTFTVMGDAAADEPTAYPGPLAGSGYAEFGGLLAELGTLVAPAHRRRGLGLLATTLAAHEALAAGLIVQWQSDINNAGAHALALAAGFSVSGLRTQVTLQSPRK